MIRDDETYRARAADDEDADDEARRQPSPGTGAVRFAAKTVDLGAYPTTPNVFYAIQRVAITGTEAEGSAGVETAVTTAQEFAYNLGSAVPPADSKVEVTWVPYRFVFTYGLVAGT